MKLIKLFYLKKCRFLKKKRNCAFLEVPTTYFCVFRHDDMHMNNNPYKW